MNLPRNFLDFASAMESKPMRTVDPRTVPVRFSNLKKMSLSPAHYYESCQSHGDETLSMRLGSGTHAMLLGKETAVFTGKTRQGAAWEDFKLMHADATILNMSEYAKARDIVASIERNRDAMALLDRCTTKEKRLEWDIGGRLCCGTPDGDGRDAIDAASLLIELKSTRCSEPERFSRDAMFRSYAAQLAWYEHGLGGPGERYIIAVENVAPYVVTVFSVPDSVIEIGHRQWRLWFELLMSCEHSNAWPGYVETVVDLEIGDRDDFAVTIEGEEVAL